MNVVAIITGLLLAAGVWTVLYRVHRMEWGVTQTIVIVQHLALGVGMLCALLVPGDLGRLCLVAGLVAFLWAGRRRWARGAPGGTMRPPGELSRAYFDRFQDGRGERPW